MVHSTWSDWLVSEIEAAEVDGMSAWYLGCNGFVVRTAETALYIDPYFGDGEPPTLLRMIPVPMDPADATVCDAVLVTHGHVDHMHPPSLDPLLEEDGTVHAPRAAFDGYDHDAPLAVPADRRSHVEPGDRFEIGDVTVHVREAHDPDATEPVTYVLEHRSGTFFHGGDTKPSESFDGLAREFDIDVGILAMGSDGRVAGADGPDTVDWYMGPDEVVAAANALELDRLVPSHWDMWRGVEGDPTALVDHVASFEYPRVLETVRIGDRIDVANPGVRPPSTLR